MSSVTQPGCAAREVPLQSAAREKSVQRSRLERTAEQVPCMLDYFEPHAVVNLSRANKRCNALADRSDVWRQLVARHLDLSTTSIPASDKFVFEPRTDALEGSNKNLLRSLLICTRRTILSKLAGRYDDSFYFRSLTDWRELAAKQRLRALPPAAGLTAQESPHAAMTIPVDSKFDDWKSLLSDKADFHNVRSYIARQISSSSKDAVGIVAVSAVIMGAHGTVFLHRFFRVAADWSLLPKESVPAGGAKEAGEFVLNYLSVCLCMLPVVMAALILMTLKSQYALTANRGRLELFFDLESLRLDCLHEMQKDAVSRQGFAQSSHTARLLARRPDAENDQVFRRIMTHLFVDLHHGGSQNMLNQVLNRQ